MINYWEQCLQGQRFQSEITVTFTTIVGSWEFPYRFCAQKSTASYLRAVRFIGVKITAREIQYAVNKLGHGPFRMFPPHNDTLLPLSLVPWVRVYVYAGSRSPGWLPRYFHLPSSSLLLGVQNTMLWLKCSFQNSCGSWFASTTTNRWGFECWLGLWAPTFTDKCLGGGGVWGDVY